MLKRKNYFDLVYITNIPAFYKKKLFNELNKFKSILVIYVGYSRELRNSDFFSEKEEYKSIYLTGGVINKLIQITQILCSVHCKEIIIGGWDSLINWYSLLIRTSVIKSIVVESSCFESSLTGIKSILKRIFLLHISKAYVPGISNERLLKSLGFKGKIIKTFSVGIFNIQEQYSFEKREFVKKFLYVGRLSREKNLDFLVSAFNKYPDLELNIVGFGPEEDNLKNKAKANIKFLGPINNRDLSIVYRNNDVFILPSTREPWGLVVEEALNNGLPVIVSNRVGCAEELINCSNGLLFDPYNSQTLDDCLNKIQDIDFYNQLRFNISKLDFHMIANLQVQSYIHE